MRVSHHYHRPPALCSNGLMRERGVPVPGPSVGLLSNQLHCLLPTTALCTSTKYSAEGKPPLVIDNPGEHSGEGRGCGAGGNHLFVEPVLHGTEPQILDGISLAVTTLRKKTACW